MPTDPVGAMRSVADTLLHPAAEVVVEFDASGRTTLAIGATGTRRVDAGRFGPLILDMFRAGRSLRDGLGRLAGRTASPGDWMRVAAAVRAAVDAGVLVPADGASGGGPPRRRRGFAAPGVHIALLDDRRRTGAFCQALARTVRPGDVVLDIGTGTGVLAVAAARAGARKVYAVEVCDLAEVAEQVAAANGAGGVVEVVHGWSTELDLPERADVLVTETIGNDPLGEHILATVADASERLLHPGARIIPRALDVLAWPLEVPRDVRERAVVTNHHLRRWVEDYGIDLSPLAAATNGGAPAARARAAGETGSWRRLGPAARIASLSLPPERRQLDVHATMPVTTNGGLGAVTLGFRARLAEGVDLTIGPGTVATSWRPCTWLLPEPIPVRSGQHAHVHLCHTTATQVDVSVTSPPTRYRLGGLVVASAFTLPGVETLPPADGGADVRVRPGAVPPLDQLIAPGPRVRLGPDHVVLHAAGDRIHIRSGTDIVVDAPPAGDDARPEIHREMTLLGSALAAIFLQRGLLPLHANTVLGPAGAVALCGDSGTGKTAISAWLDRDGLALLSDDLTPVRIGDASPPTVLPAVRRLKLREDTLVALGLDPDRYPARPADGTADSERKWLVPAWSDLPEGDDFPLAALVVLRADPTVTEVIVEPLGGAEAVHAVAASFFRPRWNAEPAIRRTVAGAALHLGTTVTVLRLRRPPGLPLLESVAAAVRELAAGRVQDLGR